MVKFHSHVNAYQRVFLHLTVWEWAFRHVETSEFSPSFRQLQGWNGAIEQAMIDGPHET